MRVNVDEKAFNDPRFRRLARLLSCSVDDAVGRVTRVWLAALNRVDNSNPNGLLTKDQAEDSTDHRGLIDAMISCELAIEQRGGKLYFAGTSERAEFLIRQREKGRIGGRPKKSKTSEKAPGLGNESQEKTQGKAPGLGNESLLSGSGSGSGSGSPSGSSSGSGSGSIGRSAGAEPGSLRRVTDHFQARYLERTGTKPTWNAATTSMLTPLLIAHGADKVIAHIDTLFDSPPRFLAGQVPDIKTLVGNFDKLARTARGRGGLLSPDQLAKMAQEQLWREREGKE